MEEAVREKAATFTNVLEGFPQSGETLRGDPEQLLARLVTVLAETSGVELKALSASESA